MQRRRTWRVFAAYTDCIRSFSHELAEAAGSPSVGRRGCYAVDDGGCNLCHVITGKGG